MAFKAFNKKNVSSHLVSAHSKYCVFFNASKLKNFCDRNCKSVSPGDGDHPVEVGLHEGEPREPHLGQEVKLDPVRVDPVRPAPDEDQIFFSKYFSIIIDAFKKHF